MKNAFFCILDYFKYEFMLFYKKYLLYKENENEKNYQNVINFGYIFNDYSHSSCVMNTESQTWKK